MLFEQGKGAGTDRTIEEILCRSGHTALLLENPPLIVDALPSWSGPIRCTDVPLAFIGGEPLE